MTNFIKKNPLISYYLCSFLSTWIIVFYLIFSGLADDFNNPPAAFFIGAMISGICPSISGFLIARIAEGKEGVKKLISRLKIKSSSKWYLITLAILPTIAIITTIISNYTLRKYEFYFSLPTLILGLIWPFFAAFGEEFGWRAFALPKYLKKYSILKSGIILGIIWASWHLPMYYIGYKEYGDYTMPALLIPGYINLIIQSVIMTYLFVKNNENLKIAILYHYTITGSALLVGAFLKTKDTAPVYSIYESMITTSMCIILIMVTYLKTRKTKKLELNKKTDI